MSTLPELTESDVARWVGTTSLGRASSYVGNAVFNARRVGNVFKAECQGSMPAPYRVQVTVGTRGITSADCSCPVGDGGRCKHVAALLLTWLDDPEEFVEVAELETALEQRTKEELIALVRMMIARYPDLETVLDLPTPGSASAEPVDPNFISRQVRRVIKAHNYYDDYGSAYAASQELEELVRLGNVYAEDEDANNAATIYETLAHEILDNYDEVYDHDGEVISVVNSCVTGLGDALDTIKDPARRQEIFRTLYDIYLWDINYGGIGVGDEVPEYILAQASPEEKQLVAGWVRATKPKGGPYSDWKTEALGGFLLDLEAESLDDEAFLRICWETGRHDDLVTRLLELGRLGEAEEAARQVEDYRLINIAQIFIAHNHEETAEKLIRRRLSTSVKTNSSSTFIEWLKARAENRGDWTEALALAQQLFWNNPILPGYEEVRRVAEKVSMWESLRPELIKRLTHKNNLSLLTEIHVTDHEVDAALETLDKLKSRKGAYAYMYDTLSINVARVAEQARPCDAIRLYMEQVNPLIDARGRENYKIAAGYLARVRKLYKQLGEVPQWDALIANLREKNRTLRALKEELNRLGL